MEKNCTVTRQLLPTEAQRLQIDKRIAAANYLFALGAERFSPAVETLTEDPEFIRLFNQVDDSAHGEEQIKAAPDFFELVDRAVSAGLTKAGVTAWIAEAAEEHGFECLDNNIQNGLADRLYRALFFTVANRCTGTSTSRYEYFDASWLDGMAWKLSDVCNTKTGSLLFAGQEIALKASEEGDVDLGKIPDGEAVNCKIIRRTRGQQRQYFVEFKASDPPVPIA